MPKTNPKRHNNETKTPDPFSGLLGFMGTPASTELREGVG